MKAGGESTQWDTAGPMWRLTAQEGREIWEYDGVGSTTNLKGVALN